LLPFATPTLEPQPSTSKRLIEMNSKKYNSEHPPPPIEEAQNIYCAARSFSSLLLNAAKASIPFGRLAVPLKHGGPWKRSWQCRIDREHAPRLIASHMLMHHGERPQSSPGPKPKPGRPPATTCPPPLKPPCCFQPP